MDVDNDANQFTEIPGDVNNRACLRCSLIKSHDQFMENGCENCDFLGMAGNNEKVLECTTSYFEGSVAMINPQGSWVAKWQRVASNYPGLYAIAMTGALPDDYLQLCEDYGK